MKRLSSRLSPLAAALAALSLAACGSSSSPRSSVTTAPGANAGATTTAAAPSGPATKLTVGVGAGVYTAPLSTSAFTSAGFQVAQQTVTSGAVAVPLLLNGQLQFAEADAVGALTAISKGAPLMIVGAVTSSGSTAATDNTNVLVKPGSPIQSAVGLEGKKVAVNAIGGAAQLSAAASITSLGGDASKVQFVEVPPSAIIPEVESGTVDAGVTSAIDPQAVGLRSVFSPMSTALPSVPLIVWITTKPYVAQHRSIVDKFSAASASADTYLAAHPDIVRNATVAGSPVKLTPAQAASVILPQFTPSTVGQAAVQRIVNVMVTAKIITAPIDLNSAIVTQ